MGRPWCAALERTGRRRTHRLAAFAFAAVPVGSAEAGTRVTEKVIYTAKAYEDGRLVSYPFTAPRDTVAKRKALERFTTELSITLECQGKFVAKFKPLRGWKSTPD